jgi:RHS repeat-associated protein
MKSHFFIRFVFALLAIVGVHSGLAQTVDGPVGVAVTIRGLDLQWGYNGYGYLDLSVAGLNSTQTASASDYDPETPQLTARLEPGKSYFLSVSSDDLDDLTIQAVPPPGYVMEIERVARERFEVGYAGYASVQIRVLAPMQEYSGRAGTSTSLMSGRVFWQVALGSLANGSSAGALSIIDTGSGSGNLTDLFTPASFLYEPTSSEVSVYYNGVGVPAPYVAGTIRQIIAPEAGVDIVATSSTQAELKFYSRAQMIPGSGGALYTFTGDPFAWYIINRDGSQPNRISIDCDVRELPTPTSAFLTPVQVKHTVLTRSGTALTNDIWTADEWYEGSGTLSRDVRTRNGSTESVVVSQPAGDPVTSLSRTYTSVPWGEEIGSETAGTSNAITTINEFYTTSDQTGNYGRPRSTITNGGTWEAYEYYDYASGTADVAGALYRSHRPFENSSTTVPTDLTTDTGVITTYAYAADAFGRRTRPTQVTTTIGGIATSSSLTTYADALSGFTGHGSLYIVTATNTVSPASGINLTTISKYFREDAGANYAYPTDDFYRGQPHSIQQPDGRKQSFVYQRGSWNGTTFTLSGNSGTDFGTCSRISVISGSSTSPGTSYTTYGGYDIDDLYLVDGKSTMQVTIRDSSALICRTETYAWSSGAWNLVSHANFDYNLSNLLTDRVDFNGGQYQASYSGEHKDWEKDDNGIRVDYTYDDAGRVSTATKYSGPTTTFAYDAENRSLNETVSAAGTGETIYSARTYDDAGRLSSELPVGMSTITYSYNPSARTRTATFPDGGTRTETYYADGQMDHVDGSAVVPQYSTFSVESDGRRTSQIYSGYSGSPRWQKGTTDWLGRPTHAERPGFSISGQPVNAEDYGYESGTGRLLTVSRTGYAPTRNDYDNLGTVIRSGLDIGNDGLVFNSSDRISENNQYFEYFNSAWWLHQETKTYPFANGTAVTTSISRKRLTGHPAGRLDETQVTDAEGNTVTRTVDVERTGATTTITTTRPGVANTQTEIISNGLSTSVQGHDGLTSSTQYDPLGRAWKLTDTRGNTSTITYKYGTSLVQSISDATGSSSGTVSYDGMGRKQWVQDAAGQYTRFTYNQRGQLTNQWGGGSYPISYTYDPTYGDQTTLSTYRDAPSGDSPTFPAGTANTTTWTYDTPSGLLWKKIDAGSQVTEFNYNARGQTDWRKWSRKLSDNVTPVRTNYGYDASTGELLTQTYNDSAEAIPTPSVTYTYTRLGQVSTVVQGTGGAGSRTFNYNTSAPWRLDNEALDASFYGSRIITRAYDSASGIGGTYGSYTPGFFKGRYTGYDLGVAGNTARDQHIAYTTSNLARLVGVTTRTTTGTQRDNVYNYNASSSLVTGYAMGSFSLTRTYEAQRNVLSSIYAQWNSGTPLTRYDYTVNTLGQRTTAKQSGSAFADYVQGLGYSATYNVYNYNGRGELETTKRYRGDTATTSPAASDELPGGRFEYRYDSIGNRVTSGSSGTSSDDEYVSNNLNQYIQKKNKSVRANGTADAAATVAVAGAINVGKKDRTWGAEIVPANSGGPVKATAAVYAAKSGAGVGPDVVRTDTSRSYFIPQLIQPIGYDLDGNMTSDSVWTYTYDAENRLVRMASLLPSGFTGMHLRLDFKYDYQGRRVEKTVYDPDATPSPTTTTRRYVYDGFNVIAETDASNNLQRTFTWGLDLAGSLTTSGGVGALLQIDDIVAGKVLSATYDGNGNVASLVNASGNLEATYEYDPSGNLLRCEGTYAKNNPFRFSTKWQDDETGLINYGVRYYSPCLGRFINRDPIGEKGGLNLYGFCGNDGVNRTDYLGNFSLRSLFRKVRNFIAGTADPLTRALVKADQRLDDGVFQTVQRNPWIVSAVSTVLSFTPFAWVSPIINAAWAMENGGSVGQIAWAYFGGKVAGAVAGGMLGSGGGLPGALARGFVAGGINGGIASYAAGGSFLSGLKIGGYWGAGLSGAGWTWQNRATVFGSTEPSSNGVNGKQLLGEISGPLRVISWWDDAPNSTRTPPSTFSQIVDILSLGGSGGPSAPIGLANIMTNNWTRNVYNQIPPTADQIRRDMIAQSDGVSVFHRIGPGNETNIKYMSTDGHNEVVLTSDGRLVTDSLNLGTYNYGTNIFTHTLLDVFPAIAFGNTVEDFQNRTLWQRIDDPAVVWWKTAGPGKP